MSVARQKFTTGTEPHPAHQMNNAPNRTIEPYAKTAQAKLRTAFMAGVYNR